MKKNIFVIGDLVIDHTVFVRIPTAGSFQAAEGEDVYEVIRRQDTAGGAANSARILACLNDGRTYLWGIIGGSPWGSFRTILKASQLLDSAGQNIEFRGVQDETDAQMHTVTRLILLDTDNRMTRRARFHDVGHVHVSDLKRETVMYHLERVHDERDPLEAIIINDLDKKCLTRDVVKAIGGFAEDNDIPLFVDPKRELSKYIDIKGTAILPNLMEWCSLTEKDVKRYRYWRDNLDNPEVLTEMANLSFRFLGNFKYHIVTCDKLGSVIIAPHPTQKHLYAVYRATAAEASRQMVDTPLGCGDLLTAVFAAEYDKTREGKGGTEMALKAYHRANITVGCYCDMSWHRMPSRRIVDERLQASPSWTPSPLAQPSISMLYLPKEERLVLSECEKVLPRVYSKDNRFNSKLQQLIQHISTQTQQVTPLSARLGALSGNGKSRIIEGLLQELPPRGIESILQMEKAEFLTMVNGEANLLDWLNKSNYKPTIAGRCFVIINEAYGDHFDNKRMLDLLEDAHNKGVRFVFVDSKFHSENSSKVQIMTDIGSRCPLFDLPGITDRPGDIPYLIADKLLESAEKDGIHTIKIEAKLLLYVTDRILEEVNPRNQLAALSTTFSNAKKNHAKGEPVLIRFKDLSAGPSRQVRSTIEISPEIFTVSR